MPLPESKVVFGEHCIFRALLIIDCSTSVGNIPYDMEEVNLLLNDLDHADTYKTLKQGSGNTSRRDTIEIIMTKEGVRRNYGGAVNVIEIGVK